MSSRIDSLAYDSRKVVPNSLFFAVEGAVSDGHDYVDDVLESGAKGIVSERSAPADFPAAWIQASQIRPYMALLANEFYGRPSEQLELIGITGTNGKTTTAYLIHAVLSQLCPALMMGTIETVLGESRLESRFTTPEAIDLQQILHRSLQAGCRQGVMEVSSHALAFDRVYQCHFPVAVFTNLSQDHLDFHSDMEGYFRAKCLLFEPAYNPAIRHAVLNGDDSAASRVPMARGVQRVTFGMSETHSVHPLELGESVDGIQMRLQLGDETAEISSLLVGRHNVYNLMAAAAATRALGIQLETICRGLALAGTVPGRFERVVLPAPYTVFVDYAHTPHALENALNLARTVASGRVLCVFGCGGDRDRAKRPLMGDIAVRNADYTIVTSDNPRHEAPQSIIDQIVAGIDAGQSNFEQIVDRRQALRRALQLARPGDLVLVAGKGHETYQEIEGRRIDFDDRRVLLEVF